MIKSASLDDELFLVLTLKGKVLRLANRIQKMLADHYELYDGGVYPELHLSLDRIDKYKKDEAIEIIEDIIPKLNAIKISIEKLDCMKIARGDKLLVLDIDNTSSLLSSAKLIHKKLYEKGISTIDNYDQWNFHITIINNNFAVNPMSEDDFEDVCYILEDFKVPFKSYASKLEIWKATLDPKERVVKSFLLPVGEEENEK